MTNECQPTNIATSAKCRRWGAEPGGLDSNVIRCWSFVVRQFSALVLFAWLYTWPVVASDWPQMLGPNRDGTVTNTGLAEVWTKDGPPKVWDQRAGSGFSGPVVKDRKLILFHRLNNQAVVTCLDARSGKPIWQFDYRTDYRDDFGFENGPRSTPTIDDDRVFTYGAEGIVHCIDFDSGKPIWSLDAKAQLDARKGFFGRACSPLVVGDLVLLNIGGMEGAGIVALDRTTGQLKWKSTDAEASYSSPTLAHFDGTPRGVFLTRDGLVGLDPVTGNVAFEYPWRSSNHASVNGATPLVAGNQIFLSASYQTGGIVLQVKNDKLSEIWSGQDTMSNHYATCVTVDGMIYGFHGRQEWGTAFRCVEWKTGKVRWSQDGLAAGTVTAADDKLLLMLEDGQLLLLKANPERYDESARAQILPSGVRAYPALADGRFYARSTNRLVSVTLMPNAEAPNTKALLNPEP